MQQARDKGTCPPTLDSLSSCHWLYGAGSSWTGAAEELFQFNCLKKPHLLGQQHDSKPPAHPTQAQRTDRLCAITLLAAGFWDSMAHTPPRQGPRQPRSRALASPRGLQGGGLEAGTVQGAGITDRAEPWSLPPSTGTLLSVCVLW